MYCNTHHCSLMEPRHLFGPFHTYCIYLFLISHISFFFSPFLFISESTHWGNLVVFFGWRTERVRTAGEGAQGFTLSPHASGGDTAHPLLSSPQPPSGVKPQSRAHLPFLRLRADTFLSDISLLFHQQARPSQAQPSGLGGLAPSRVKRLPRGISNWGRLPSSYQPSLSPPGLNSRPGRSRARGQ